MIRDLHHWANLDSVDNVAFSVTWRNVTFSNFYPLSLTNIASAPNITKTIMNIFKPVYCRCIVKILVWTHKIVSLPMVMLYSVTRTSRFRTEIALRLVCMTMPGLWWFGIRILLQTSFLELLVYLKLYSNYIVVYAAVTLAYNISILWKSLKTLKEFTYRT